MTVFVLTLVGNAISAPLELGHVEKVQDLLGASTKTDWLAENEACDMFHDSPISAAELLEKARQVLSGARIDVVCTTAKNRRKKLLVSDMDSTIINQECIDELGDATGVGPQIRRITAAVVRGDIDFSSALHQRLALMKGMKHDVLERVYRERISLYAGARTLVQTMRHHGAFCVLVSGGFSFFTSRIAERVGFHEHRANRLAFENGKLTGQVLQPVLDRSAKLDTMDTTRKKLGLTTSEVLAVGDGANDIEMIRAAGLGVAFHGPDAVRKQATACIDHGDLSALLYIQGFRRSQFILS